MNLRFAKSRTALAIALAAQCVAVHAAGDGSGLGPGKTPLGGDRAASKDIPAWSGIDPALPGWTYGKRRADHWRFKGEKPILTIDASNADKHASRLTPGQLALLKKVPGYQMDVYPSHRNCSAPDFVQANTKKNVGFASLTDDGAALKDAYLPGIPFPEPQNGAEVMWNSKLHYRGVGFNLPKGITVLSPRPGGDNWIRAEVETTTYYPWAEPGSRKFSETEGVESYGYNLTQSPSALAGQAIALTTNMNTANEMFMYFPGQRRVRRMSTYGYDAPIIGYENQYNADEVYIFSGRLDRYDWKVIGKKELYIPYNAFGGYEFSEKMDTVAKERFVASSARRYELHRVWEVQATVKTGARHVAPKRTFYVDEDSWVLVAAEDYDSKGALFKVRESFPIPVFETGSCSASAFVEYNVTEGRYLIDVSPIGAGKDIQWFTVPTMNRFKKAFYTSDNLRAISDR